MLNRTSHPIIYCFPFFFGCQTFPFEGLRLPYQFFLNSLAFDLVVSVDVDAVASAITGVDAEVLFFDLLDKRLEILSLFFCCLF